MVGTNDTRIRRVLIAGDSHVEVIKDALQKRNENGEVRFTALRLAKTMNNGITIGDVRYHDLVKLMSDLDARDVVVLRMLGTQHNVLGLIQHEQPFDFFLARGDEAACFEAPAAVIPEAALRDMFISLLAGERISRIRQIVARMCLLAPPPPNPDTQLIMARAKKYRGKLTAEHGISPAGLRLKLWQLEMSVLHQFCDRQNIQFVLPPDSALSSDGFLKAEFRGADALHANASYGELVLKQLESVTLEAPTMRRETTDNA